MEETSTDEGGHKLLNKEGQENGADSSEVEIMNKEGTLELEGLPVAHPLTSTEDDGVVQDNEDGRLLQGRHGSLPLDKLKVANRIAGDGRPGLVEDGP